ncbi:MAG: hypothetical protein BJ554DRAFT_2438 [Olpidium bornovanus]|uniref:NFACT protein C-terminal domain-containing protein n=1 Tax=Olpidium bornovanus TaxID=278681 RepID=A0A8H8DGF4_9FUNG|nr:MAG: hypothetical protein BJ554DRAFT_2438 [Olpidium bornovanus]
MVRGKKNFLPPAQLVYGFGILFKLDESSTARHIALRKAAEAERPNSEVGLDDENADDATKENLELEEEVVAAGSADSIAIAGESFDENQDGDFEGAEGEDMESDNEQNVEREKGELSEDGEDQPLSHIDKYGLAEFCTPPDEEDSAPVDSDGRARSAANEERLRGYLSAKERKERRKQRVKGTAVQNGQCDPERDTLAPALGKSDAQIGSGDFPGRKETVTPPPPQPARGRKAKLKKIKAKYGEQDEEERALRMEILGDMHTPDLGVDKNEAAEIREMLKEENIALLDEEESRQENISLLESLTGSPLPEDVLVHAIPVCAPYPVLQQYKYKVKLTPGTTKKGKAVKEAVKYFLASPDLTAREKELIKSIPDTEMISQMIAKVKVSAPNLEAVKKKAKQKSRKK